MGPVIDPDDPSGATPASAASARSSEVASKPAVPVSPASGALVAATQLSGRKLISQSVSVAAFARFRSPALAAVEDTQRRLREHYLTPVTAVLDSTRGISRLVEQQNAMLRSMSPQLPTFVLPELPWWTYTDRWPTAALTTSLLRPLDVLRPQLPDLSRTLDNLFDAARWIGTLGLDLWRELRHAGRRVAFWAVMRACAALERNDIAELEEFVRDWLGAKPTPPRVEALVEALLQIEVAQYAPDEGTRLLDDLTELVKLLAAQCRHEHEPLLGTRRGAGTIAQIGDVDTTVLHQLGFPHEPSVEDLVMDRFHPAGDPRLIELVNELPPVDRKIATMKIVTGCSWLAAAETCGLRREHGEIVRQRLHRQRDRIVSAADPWFAWASMDPRKQAGFGHVRPSGIVIDGATGIWP